MGQAGGGTRKKEAPMIRKEDQNSGQATRKEKNASIAGGRSIPAIGG